MNSAELPDEHEIGSGLGIEIKRYLEAADRAIKNATKFF